MLLELALGLDSHLRRPPPASVIRSGSNSNSGVGARPGSSVSASASGSSAPRSRPPRRAPRSAPDAHRPHRGEGPAGPDARIRAGPPACAAAREAHHRAPRRTPLLGLVGRLGLGHDLLRDLLELHVHIRVGAPSDPGAIDRHHPRLDQPRLVAQLEHLAEQLRQRLLVAADEPRHSHMIGNQVPSDHAKSNMLPAMTLDRARGTHPGREREQDHRHHQRRLIRRPAVTVSPIGGIERRQIHLLDGIDHEPRQMIRPEPIPHVRRQQKPLLTTTLNEVLRHAEIVLDSADGTAL